VRTDGISDASHSGKPKNGGAADNLVDLESDESFPASDAPSWPMAHLGAPAGHGEGDMTETRYPPSSAEIRHTRRELAPEIHKAFDEFSQKVFADGALPAKTKQLIAVAVAHVTQCPYCIRGHTKAALRHGATRQELMEAIWVAAEMRAGGAFAHSTIAIEEMTADAK
jgi:AhpD family alkylhydroperoxidase